MVFCIQKGDFSTRIASLYGSEPSTCGFGIQNSDFRTRITSLHGNQTSSVVLCIHNSDIMTISYTRHYGSQTSPLVLRMQNNDWLASELLVSMNLRPHPSFCACKTNETSIRNTSTYVSPSSVVFACKIATLGPELQVSMGPWPHLWFFAFKTATLAPELQDSMHPNFHLWFWHSKQWL